MSADVGDTLLAGLARRVARPGMLMLEIGTWTGESAFQLASVAKEHNGHLVCLDWWQGSVTVTGGPHVWHGEQWIHVFRNFLEAAEVKGWSETIIPLRADSRIGTSLLREGAFDLVYIDGEHSYDTVRHDIVTSVPLLRDWGILAGHDLEQRLDDSNKEEVWASRGVDCIGYHPGVTLAVGLLLPDALSLDERNWYKVMSREAKEEFFQKERETR